MKWFASWICLLVPVSLALAQGEDSLSETEAEFFEAKIRPVLVESCYPCHNSQDTAEGDLILDHKAALRAGGQSGATIDLEQPHKSLLLRVIRHELEGFGMPQDGEKLSDEVIADFEKWITMGAPDPRQDPPIGGTPSVETWEATREKRKQWWSFQPIQDPQIPDVADPSWSDHPIDRFIQARIEATGLRMAEPADRRTLIRRLSFVLRGLPPSIAEVNAFLIDESPKAYENLVDSFLDSKQFGEHWARHWMDIVRYAESHGSEGDPAIPYAWKYRDYLIRALNADVPYNQLLLEHIAGDLLETPRINEELHLNESAIGPAHWRMCFHGFAPTDALEEKVRFIDDDINVFSKAFLGLTVSCARCHNHKFDPISQADYYALFGILGSTRPGMVDARTKEDQFSHQDELQKLWNEIRTQQAAIWTKEFSELESKLRSLSTTAADRNDVLYPLHLLHQSNRSDAWSELVSAGSNDLSVPDDAFVHWDLTKSDDAAKWFAHGSGTAHQIATPGRFIVSPDVDSASQPLLPAGVYSHLLSTKHRNTLLSPKVHLGGIYEAWIHVAGNGDAMLRYVVQDYPRSGTVYPVTTLNGGDWKWQRYDLTYWDGDEIHFELTTAADSPVLAKTDAERNWFGIRNVLIAPIGSFCPPQQLKPYDILIDHFSADETLPDLESLVSNYLQLVSESVSAWQNDHATDRQVALLNGLIKRELLSQIGMGSQQIAELVNQYRLFEQTVPVAERVPGLLEADAADQSLFIRGNHRQQAGTVPRRFLEAIDETPYQSTNSGRIELADDLIRDDNPLTRRVIVNRIWHHLFGAGLVRTVDNFGRLGEEPSHPELLEHLATQFSVNAWSIKKSIRNILLSKTWQQSAQPSASARQIDPENRLLSHAHIRRLDAEMLRDALLTVSGQLETTMFGPPVGTETASSRRSVYLSVIRNSLNLFLQTFDAPVPFAPMGRRDVTNVPAQSLTMLNDPFVIGCAKEIARRETRDDKTDLVALFESLLGRPPTDGEVSEASLFVNDMQRLDQVAHFQRQEIAEKLNDVDLQSREILGRVRERILQQRATDPPPHRQVIDPVAAWDFEKDAQDRVGHLHGILHGDAQIVDGAIVLQGSGYAATTPVDFPLREKTLHATVQLSNMQQRGGGVMTVQDLSGTLFDAIVFGEQQPQHWLAGSNNFARTESLQGDAESAAADMPVQMTITYSADGTIRGYRNGIPYGKPYRKAPLQPFEAGQAQIVFGLRHGSPGGNRMLSGRILDAALFDRALTADEVAAFSTSDPSYISQSQIESEMTDVEAQHVRELQIRRVQLQQQLDELGPERSPDQAWADLAHALLNTKEFLYYR